MLALPPILVCSFGGGWGGGTPMVVSIWESENNLQVTTVHHVSHFTVSDDKWFPQRMCYLIFKQPNSGKYVKKDPQKYFTFNQSNRALLFSSCSFLWHLVSMVDLGGFLSVLCCLPCWNYTVTFSHFVVISVIELWPSSIKIGSPS